MNKFLIIIVIFLACVLFGIIVFLKMQKAISSGEVDKNSILKIMGQADKPLVSGVLNNATTVSKPKDSVKSQNVADTDIAINPKNMNIDISKKYEASLYTDLGIIKISLFADKTPITVNNFISLAKKGFYNNTIFHRVISGFMIQGGDPLRDGTGGPGYKFDDELFIGDYLRGTIAMANSGPDTNGSQFFIIHQDTLGLEKNYVIFGQVLSGIDVVDKIAESEVVENAFREKSRPIKPAVINKIEISEK